MNLKTKLFVRCLLLPMAAAAQSWHGQIGALTLHGPEYVGADEERTRVLPLVMLRYDERLYLGNSRYGLGAGLGWKITGGTEAGFC